MIPNERVVPFNGIAHFLMLYIMKESLCAALDCFRAARVSTMLRECCITGENFSTRAFVPSVRCEAAHFSRDLTYDTMQHGGSFLRERLAGLGSISTFQTG
jgi:hypothetical protein